MPAYRYEPSPADVASSCDVTFAMLADPESAVYALVSENSCLQYYFVFVKAHMADLIIRLMVCTSTQVEVACGANGAAQGMAPGKG